MNTETIVTETRIGDYMAHKIDAADLNKRDAARTELRKSKRTKVTTDMPTTFLHKRNVWDYRIGGMVEIQEEYEEIHKCPRCGSGANHIHTKGGDGPKGSQKPRRFCDICLRTTTCQPIRLITELPVRGGETEEGLKSSSKYQALLIMSMPIIYKVLSVVRI